MTQFRPGREVMVAGVGLHPFGRFSSKDLAALALDAVLEALKDADVRGKDVPGADCGRVYYQCSSVVGPARAAGGSGTGGAAATARVLPVGVTAITLRYMDLKVRREAPAEEQSAANE